jgi:hypothetical protein
MTDIALAYVTCDKFAHVWDEWYKAFNEYWGLSMPMYFCGEEKPLPFPDFENIPHKSVPVKKWTNKLRAQIEQIPEEYIFVWLDDHIQLKSIDREFTDLWIWLRANRPDSLRIMPRPSRSQYDKVGDVCYQPLYKVRERTHYRVSFSPNIFQRDFLLDVLSTDDRDPWQVEINSTAWGKDVYSYHINGWCVNKYVHG